jgi:hypothetical protein
MKVCVICGNFHVNGHIVKESVARPEWEGRRVCRECWNEIEG